MRLKILQNFLELNKDIRNPLLLCTLHTAHCTAACPPATRVASFVSTFKQRVCVLPALRLAPGLGSGSAHTP